MKYSTREAYLEALDCFSSHLKRIDAVVDVFAGKHSFEVAKNLHNTPCRNLRRGSQPHQVIVLGLEEFWRDLDFEPDLPHSITVSAYYRPREGKRWFKRHWVVRAMPFSQMEPDLAGYFEDAINVLDAWKIPAIEEDESVWLQDDWARTII